MSTAVIKLYDILVEKGVDKTLAREAVDEFLTREEATKSLSTKEDIANLRAEMYKAFLAHGFIVVATILATAVVLARLNIS